MALAGKNDSIVCSAFYPKFGPWYFDKALVVFKVRHQKLFPSIMHILTFSAQILQNTCVRTYVCLVKKIQ